MVSPITFLKEVRSELTKVIWPTPAEVIRLTWLVILISLAVGLFIGALDFIFTKTFSFLIGG
ncbi:preprotein translocase subunit SecE [Candidatus Microgenomates bacterium]|nr:preprotein translocase subunit SecE [Candidatus Microgenomates bacterium]MBI2622048.1 preprotein translocase subunit SecE [Candidatus Microgenomates bacterium]